MNNFNQGQRFNNNRNNDGANNNNGREPLTIDFKPHKFEGTLKTQYTTTIELAGLINNWIFKPLFPDYTGCMLTQNNFTGQFDVILYFKDAGEVPEGKLKAIKPIRAFEQGQRNIVSSLDRINAYQRHRTYELTQDAKDVLSRFIQAAGVGNKKKIDWNKIVCEEQEPGTRILYLKVIGIELNKLLKAMYGRKDSNGNAIEYAINVVRTVGNSMNVPGVYSNYLLTINRLDTKQVADLTAKLGMIPSQGRISMIRAE